MTVLTQQQIDGYHENGFLVVEDLVSPEDIQRLKDDTLKICRGEYPCESIQPLPISKLLMWRCGLAVSLTRGTR
ncbi:MAG TPA: hypothetical protein VNA16_05205 [Abditibacteriaceae bacterium]|nr:hypothetical protein [Abditibacteriaceae bacterium]